MSNFSFCAFVVTARKFKKELDKKKADPNLDWTGSYNCASILYDCGQTSGVFKKESSELPGNDWGGPQNLIDQLKKEYGAEAKFETGYFGYNYNNEPTIVKQ